MLIWERLFFLALLGFCVAFGHLAENSFDAFHVELGCAVVVVYAVLLLLYISELRVAVPLHVGD